MLVELTVVVQYVIPNSDHIKTTGVCALAALITSPRCLFRIKERTIIDDAEILGECGREFQRMNEIVRTVEFLGVIQREDSFSACQQTVLQGMLVFIALYILQRVRDITYTIKIRVVISRILGIVNRRISRRVNHGQNQTTTVSTCSGTNTALVIAVRISDIGAQI